MSFWTKLRAALNIGAKVAEVAAPAIAIKDPKLGAVVGQVGAIVEHATEAEPKEETKQ